MHFVLPLVERAKRYGKFSDQHSKCSCKYPHRGVQRPTDFFQCELKHRDKRKKLTSDATRPLSDIQIAWHSAKQHISASETYMANKVEVRVTSVSRRRGVSTGEGSIQYVRNCLSVPSPTPSLSFPCHHGVLPYLMILPIGRRSATRQGNGNGNGNGNASKGDGYLDAR